MRYSKLLIKLSVLPLALVMLLNGYEVIVSFGAGNDSEIVELDGVQSDLELRRVSHEKTGHAISLMETAITLFNDASIADPGDVPADPIKNVTSFGAYSRSLSSVWLVYDKEKSQVTTSGELDDLIQEYGRISFSTPPLTPENEKELTDFISVRIAGLNRRKISLEKLETQRGYLDVAENAWNTKDYGKAKTAFDKIDVLIFQQNMSDEITSEKLNQYQVGCEYYIELGDKLKDLRSLESSLSFIEAPELDEKIRKFEAFMKEYGLPPALCDDEGHNALSDATDSLRTFHTLLVAPFVRDLTELPSWCRGVLADYSVFKEDSAEYATDLSKRLLKSLHEDIQGFFNAINVVKPAGLDDWFVVFTVDDERILISSKFTKALNSIEPRLKPTPPKNLYHEGKGRLINFAYGFAKFDRSTLSDKRKETVDLVLGPHSDTGVKLPLIKIFDEVESLQKLLNDNKQIDFEVWKEAQLTAARQLAFIEDYNGIGGGVPVAITRGLEDVDMTLGTLLNNESEIQQLLDLLK